MLFNGEAIFGVVDFAGGSQSSMRSAEKIVQHAVRVGAHASYQVSGTAVLGFVNREIRSGPAAPIVEAATVAAVAVGELLARGQRESLYIREPDRSSFVANEFAAAGLPFLQKLDGTFAAAIWNEKDREFILICDRRGDGRLFYTVENGQLLFSSWLSLLARPRAFVDRQAISEFLRFLYIAPPRTIYSGIRRVEGGHYVTATSGRVVTHRWPCQAVENNGYTARDGDGQDLADFQTRFETAIGRRIAGRRAGVLLSSGVDSAALAAGCEHASPGGVETFTVGFDNVELDETEAARALARQIGVPHTELRFGMSQYSAAFERVISGMEQPFGDPVQLPLALACEHARRTVDVLCDGTGSDGLFGAPIPRHLKFSLEIASKLPVALRRNIAATARLLRFSYLSRHATLFEFDDPEELFITWSGWNKRELIDILNCPIDFSESGFYRIFRSHASSGSQPLYDAIGVFPPDDSRFEAAALAGLPLELPYHDVDLWSYVRNLPESCRIADGETKVILRRLFSRYFPAAGLTTQKHYFNIPLQELMARSKYSLIEEHLAPETIKRHGLVDANRARTYIDRFIAGDERLRFKVWALLVLHAWLDKRV